MNEVQVKNGKSLEEHTEQVQFFVIVIKSKALRNDPSGNQNTKNSKQT